MLTAEQYRQAEFGYTLAESRRRFQQRARARDRVCGGARCVESASIAVRST